MIFDDDMETLPREELEALQLRRLKTLTDRVYANVPFYRKAFDDAGVRPSDIQTLADLRYLPFTEKQDLRNHYPFGLFAVPKDNVVRLHASSGTTGKATVVGYTKRDVENWATLMARSLVAAGATKRDIIHVAYGYGLFTGGLGAHYGAERLGATTIPVSGGSTKRQVVLLRDFGATVICCTPSYSLFLYETALESGIDIKELPLRIGVFGAEPWTEEMRRDIETKLGIKAIDIYGLSEIMGPGVGIECIEAQDGAHIQEDHFLLEIIDPVTKEPLPPGETGELVITTLCKEALPMIRYRTRDITSLNFTPCRCGRTFARMHRVMGRSDDMLIIRGVNVFPSQIESILLETQGLTPHYQLLVKREGNLDTLEVQVEVDEKIFSDEIKNLQRLGVKIQKHIKEFLGVTATVKLVEPRSIQRSEGKAKRIIDMRSVS
jgi:phenylacetate-CoA ligase